VFAKASTTLAEDVKLSLWASYYLLGGIAVHF